MRYLEVRRHTMRTRPGKHLSQAGVTLARAWLPEWLAGPLSTWAAERLFSRKARELDFLDFDYIERLWHRHRTRKADQSFALWCLINLFSWYEYWFA